MTPAGLLPATFVHPLQVVHHRGGGSGYHHPWVVLAFTLAALVVGLTLNALLRRKATSRKARPPKDEVLGRAVGRWSGRRESNPRS